MHAPDRSTSTFGLVIAALALGASSVTCGGGSGSCGVQPCGGTPTGNWTAKSACVDQATLNMQFLGDIATDCPTASLSNAKYNPSGTLTFGTDMSYTAAVTMGISFNMNLPASCLNGASCATVNAGIQSIVGMDGITSATCTGSGSCTCAIAGVVDVEASSGTWASAGTTLTLTATSGGNGDSGPYCVQGNTLHLLSVDMSMAMVKITSDITFSK
jgi:hypothetical protein